MVTPLILSSLSCSFGGSRCALSFEFGCPFHGHHHSSEHYALWRSCACASRQPETALPRHSSGRSVLSSGYTEIDLPS
eukprot:COSAG01_NODE_381_length_17848_cov_10.220338_18_plen_78_part_00